MSKSGEMFIAMQEEQAATHDQEFIDNLIEENIQLKEQVEMLKKEINFKQKLSEMNIEQKLFLFQRKFDSVTMDKKNSHFNNKYASLPQILKAIKPCLSYCGLLVEQGINKEGFLFTKITDVNHTEQFRESFTAIDPKLTSQQSGSFQTYHKRYHLNAMLCLELEEFDDDGNAASGIK